MTCNVHFVGGFVSVKRSIRLPGSFLQLSLDSFSVTEYQHAKVCMMSVADEACLLYTSTACFSGFDKSV